MYLYIVDENMSQHGAKKTTISIGTTRAALSDMSNKQLHSQLLHKSILKPNSSVSQSVLLPAAKQSNTRIIIQSNRSTVPTPAPVLNVQLETSNIDAMLISPQPQHKQQSKTMQHVSLPLNIPIDQPNQLSKAHLYVVEYAGDILDMMYQRESLHTVNNTYMSSVQHDINSKMREILIDWLHEVSSRFKLLPETIHLTVNIVDRFLAKQPVIRNRLQLVGCTAMLIACKYQEIYVPEINDFIHISDNAYTRQDIIDCEQLILNCIEFNITTQSTMSFMERYILYCSTIQHDTQSYNYCLYTIQLCLQNYDMLQYKPSTIASAALYCVLYSLNTLPQHWSAQLEHELHIDPIQFKRCVYDISVLLQNAATCKYGAVTRKFNRSMYKQASTLNNIVQPIII